MAKRIDFVTLFPEVVQPYLGASILGRAQQSGLVEFSAADPRDYCYDRHRKVDDSPYGGEPGMLIRVEPVAATLAALGVDENSAVVMTSPTGKPFRQQDAQDLSERSQVVFLCGHYEGFDYRVETEFCTHAFSIGDFILTGGELPALVMADAVVRLIPGVLGSADSLAADAHSDGILSAPNYTRPENWEGHAVPDVLLSGNHQAIADWRRKQALLLTKRLRPDLLSQALLTKRDLRLLEETD